MAKKRIAIACQGGGSQCAFVAGALKTLFGRGVQDRFKIVGLSGTSGGALTAALRALLVKHIDFQALPTLVDAESPTLLLGAGDVLEGSFKIFSSALGEISVDAVLASAAIPNLFPAVQIDGHAYWDGIFASNPPVISFLRRPLMGKGKIPDEIWIIDSPARRAHCAALSATIFITQVQLKG